MQIPTTSLASSVAGATSKAAQETTHPDTQNSVGFAPQVEKSEQSNSDRDAQGQGDGLTGRRARPQKPTAVASSPEATPSMAPAPLLPDEPPSQIDLLG